jgi:MFS family permease
MERTSEPRQDRGIVEASVAELLALRPAFALVAAWLTTAGHTASFREMIAARGWVTAEGYSLHSIFLLSITLTLLAAPRLARRAGSYRLVVTGLAMLGTGSFINGALGLAPPELLALGRVLAGIGAGLVIRSAPRILPAGEEERVAWAGIVLPAAGPVVIALAVEWSPWWSWQGGFLFEVVLALLSLALVLSIADPPDLDRDSPPGPAAPLDYLPAAVVAALSVWYVMQWGQLHGWLEGPDITAAVIVGSIALCVLLWTIWPRLDPGTLREGLPRLGLIAYGGFVQYFNSLDMGVYGGLLVNFSPWMRSWLIWSLTIGSTAALALGRIVWPKRSPGYAGATLGLLVLAAGMSLSHYNTMNWPFWSLLNTVEFNWFAAPQHWQLAPARFLMGFGSGMVLLAMTTSTSPEPRREARIRPLLQVAQFAGGTLSVGALVTVLLAGHQLQYSYVADRGFIQSVERGDRNARLAAAVATTGTGTAAQQAEALEFRAVNYEADNLVFATIYGGFLVASLVLAVVCGVYALVRYLSPPAASRAPREQGAVQER